MIILFIYFVLSKQQRDVEFDNNNYWTSIDRVSNNNIYRIKSLTQPYYYVQVILFQEDLSFLLTYDFNQNPEQNKSRGDYINFYEKKRTSFLKIKANGKTIVISAYSNNNLGNYNITIWGSNKEYCDNNCSNQGECTIDGCLCYSGYVGSDCYYAAQEINMGQENISFYGDEIKFFYLSINTEEQDIFLNLETDSYNGIEVLMQLSEAIILPNQIPIHDQDYLLNQYIIKISQPLYIRIKDNVVFQFNTQVPLNLIFVARQINGLVSTLTIKYEDYNNMVNAVSIIVIIIIVVAISATVIIIIILFFVCKSIRKRKLLRTQAILRMARLDAQALNQNDQQQNQQNLFDQLILVQFNDQKNQDNCAICLDNLNNDQEVRQTYCHHNFHSICIKEWLMKNKKECPVCRTTLTKQDPQTNKIVIK
ncbi:unnamed protein product [Paramecium sonneborni]|uniref:RING-type domain-containing protein n=1 Tax=Paramecium sonneborni TaxID=65129 RepID=A0A8S1P8L6_9CILI|nr:unnamed protein product [Paramecium sonneborni]